MSKLREDVDPQADSAAPGVVVTVTTEDDAKYSLAKFLQISGEAMHDYDRAYLIAHTRGTIMSTKEWRTYLNTIRS